MRVVLLRELRKFLVHDQNTPTWRKFGPYAVLLAVLVLLVGMFGGRNNTDQGVGQPAAPWLSNPTDTPTTTDATGPTTGADTVATVFMDTLLTAHDYPAGRGGDRAWVAALAPYMDTNLQGTLGLVGRGKVPKPVGGKPVRVVHVEGESQFGDLITVRATLTDGSHATVDVAGQPDNTWRVSDYRFR